MQAVRGDLGRGGAVGELEQRRGAFAQVGAGVAIAGLFQFLALGGGEAKATRAHEHLLRWVGGRVAQHSIGRLSWRSPSTGARGSPPLAAKPACADWDIIGA